MFDEHLQHRRFQAEHCCEFERTLNGEYCGEKSEMRLDGLRLCERHADRLRLVERIAYWRAILAHIRLWSGEARARNRDDVVCLLEIERARSTAALEGVYEELHNSWDREDDSGDGRAPPELTPLSLLLSLSVTG